MERQREDKWESSYRREADAIHVPEALMEKTRQAMERAMEEEAGVPQPENMRKTGGKRTSRKKTAGILAAAACLCLVFLGSYLIYGSRQAGDLHVIQMTASQDNWDLGVNLGVAGTAGEQRLFTWPHVYREGHPRRMALPALREERGHHRLHAGVRGHELAGGAA